MNPTIKTMAIAAGFPKAGFNQDGPIIYNEREIELLARFIINECVALSESLQYSGDQIREHFGVRK
jgi:hypothetical protein